MRWTLNLKSVPAYMPNELVINELTIAFNAWAAAAGKDFDYVAEGDVAVAKDDTTLVRVDFDDRSHANEFIFDGEGGALAHASAAGITFDVRALVACIHLCVHLLASACICCMYLPRARFSLLYVCVCVSVLLRIANDIYIYINIYTHMCVYVYKYKCMYVCIC